MTWFKQWIIRLADRWRMNEWGDAVDELASKRTLRRNNRINTNSSGTKVQHTYDDESVINFKVYGANGGKIVETTRYNPQNDMESIRRYVIEENADLATSLGKIVTMEYLR